MTYTTLVSTDQLAAHLDDWAIADCRFDLQQPEWGRAQYRAAHIPGAVYVSLNGDLSAHAGPRGGRHPLPTVEVLAATLGRLGIERRTQVVVYDQDMGMYASRLWWTLRYLGHEAVALLDAAVRAGRPRGGRRGAATSHARRWCSNRRRGRRCWRRPTRCAR